MLEIKSMAKVHFDIHFSNLYSILHIMYYIYMLAKYLKLKPVVHELRIDTQFYSISFLYIR